MNNIPASSPFSPPGGFWRSHRTAIVFLAGIALLRSLCVIATAFTVRDLANGYDDWVPVKLVLLAAALVLIRWQERVQAERIGTRYINRIRRMTLKRLMRASVHDIQSMSVGSISARLGADLASLKRWITLGFSRLISNSLLFVAIIGTLALMNWIAAIAVLLTLLVAAVVSLYLGGLLSRSLKEVRSIKIKLQSMIVERFSQYSAVRANAQELTEIARVHRVGRSLETCSVQNGGYLGLIRGLAEASTVLMVVASILAHQLFSPDAGFSQLIGMLALILFMGSPIREISRTLEYFQGARLSIAKLVSLQQIPRIMRGSDNWVNELPEPGSVRVKNLDFHPVFRKLNKTVKYGEKVAIVGPNGAGKSTLIKLFAGLLKPDRGIIRIHGVDPRRMSPLMRANAIGVAGAGYGIIKGRIKNVIDYRRESGNRFDRDLAAVKTGLSGMIKRNALSFDYLITESANDLSSGERAMLGLSRAIVGSPELLLLDEADANLDEQGQAMFDELVCDYPGTVILISHRNDVLSYCNQVWDLGGSAAVDSQRKMVG